MEFWTDFEPARTLPSMGCIARLTLAGVLFGVLFGCSGEREVTWLKLLRIEPAWLEPGISLRIAGAGFPVDQACELQLRGRSHRPGLPSVAVETRLPARVLSDEEVTSVLDAPAWSALGGRGSFDGELRLECRAPRGGRTARGVLHSSLDLAPLVRAAVYEPRLRAGARHLLDSAGIVLADEEPTLSGLCVASVRDPSPASTLGLRHGDVIVRASGVSIHSLEDFAPPPNAQRVPLRVQRPGRAAPFEADLVGLPAPELSTELTRLTALLTWLFAVLLLLSPLPSFVPPFARALSRLTDGPAAFGLLGGRRQRARSRKRRLSPWLRRLALSLSSSAVGIWLVRFELPDLVAVRWLSLYLGFAALCVTLVLMGVEGGLLVRLRMAAGTALRLLVVGTLIACACALEGTRSLGAMVRAEGAWPWHWALLQKPVLFVALPLYVVCASVVGGVTNALDSAGSAPKLLGIERVLANVVLSALGVVIFAGGWQCPAGIALDGSLARLPGAAYFVLETWSFAWLLSLSRRLDWAHGIPPLAAVLGCLATVALTALWLWLDLTPDVELALGRALAAGLAITALVTAVRARASSAPAPQESV